MRLDLLSSICLGESHTCGCEWEEIFADLSGVQPSECTGAYVSRHHFRSCRIIVELRRTATLHSGCQLRRS